MSRRSLRGGVIHSLLIILGLFLITLSSFTNIGWARSFCWPRLVKLDKVYSTDHFSIYYNTTPGHPDAVDESYVSKLAEAFEKAYNTYSNYGFRLPSGKITVRVCSIGANGMTQPPFGISIDKNLDDNQLKATSAHELFHVVQNRYLTLVPKYMAEGTAYFMEHVVFPDSEDYITWICYALVNLNQRFFDFRNRGSDIDNSTVLYWQYAAEQYSKIDEDPPGVSFIKTLWEEASLLRGIRGLDFLDNFLQKHAETTFRESFTNWIAANYIRSLNNIESKYQYRYNEKYNCLTGPIKIHSVGNCPNCKSSISLKEKVVSWGAFFTILSIHPGLQALDVSFQIPGRRVINLRDFVDLQVIYIKGGKGFLSYSTLSFSWAEKG